MENVGCLPTDSFWWHPKKTPNLVVPQEALDNLPEEVQGEASQAAKKGKRMGRGRNANAKLGGGFKHFLFSPLFGEDSHFD